MCLCIFNSKDVKYNANVRNTSPAQYTLPQIVYMHCLLCVYKIIMNKCFPTCLCQPGSLYI